MASPAQIAANQANSRKSTGPRSAEGKSASRFNAIKHGLDAESAIIPGEDPAEYDALVRSYHADFQPASPSEAFHVQTMLRAAWQKLRFERVEADLTRALIAETPGQSLAAALLSDSPAAKLLARVQRQIAGFERVWFRAINELRRVRRQDSSADDKAFTKYLDLLCSPTAGDDLASFRQIENPEVPASPTAATAPKNWPPLDEKTGRPLYFVG